ncbi:class I SAM-dependent methyltransferase [Saccharothrix texasensis]|uniref:Ubiquinone/menaquinone biosynthesis C-methylase UbiE n=1 Tax=Saccharothrix texasensis TaxID=103734 RepID=A0A3N1H032_9PSEU|nr:class I SAM-dependent methyltransferase [Saccharothrix texasensis]ROP35736.1 ubiquinone/menaquinone biosynthesis C-methylase UbiE [Saccharothrix texasensis]
MKVDSEVTRLRAVTRAHYERYPFIEGGGRRVDLWRSRLADLLPDDLVRGARVLDVGASVGEVARSLSDRGAHTTCVDLTETATRRCRELHQAVDVVQGDALALPFRDASFDHSIAIGVLHHTADCARGLREMARVTRPGGSLVVLLYSRWTPYHALYFLTGPLRQHWTAESVNSLPRWLKEVLRFALYVHTGLRLDDELLKRMVADQVWTPRATFHTPREVERWGRSYGLQVVKRKRIPMYSNIFVFECAGVQ